MELTGKDGEDALSGWSTPDELTAYIQQLYRTAGFPTIRAIGHGSGASHTRVHDYLRGGAARARWVNLVPVIAYLGGNEAEAKKLWQQSRGRALRGRLVRDPNIVAQLDSMVGLLTEIRDELRAINHRQ